MVCFFFICGVFFVCRHLTLEVKKCREELVSKESELERLRKDVGVKTSQISCMEESLQHIKSQLISKNDIGKTCLFFSIGFVEFFYLV